MIFAGTCNASIFNQWLEQELCPILKKNMVVTVDQNKVGKFKRFYDGGGLAANEKLLYYHNQHERLRIVPNSFMFQEGHAKFYEKAKYGVFKFDAKGSHILVGLADNKMQMIQPNN